MNWNIQAKGSLEAVRTAINGDKKLPKSIKDFLLSQVAEPPAGVLGCKVDAYSQAIPLPGQMKVTVNTQITVEWIKV